MSADIEMRATIVNEFDPAMRDLRIGVVNERRHRLAMNFLSRVKCIDSDDEYPAKERSFSAVTAGGLVGFHLVTMSRVSDCKGRSTA